jgi:hypothetical protein
MLSIKNAPEKAKSKIPRKNAPKEKFSKSPRIVFWLKLF